MKTYTVYYRTGGSDNFRWHRALPVVSREEAITQQADLEHRGYRAHFADTASLDRLGMPETFE